MSVTATYYLETDISLNEAAARIANEQSSGFTDNDIERFAEAGAQRGRAEVVALEEVEVLDRNLHLPMSRPAGSAIGPVRAARLEVRFPDADTELLGIDGLLNVVFGEPQDLGVLRSLELVDIADDAGGIGPGPRSGLAGIRHRVAVPDRPLVGAPIKPSTGLDLDDHIARATAAARGGADIVKDDELCADTSYNPLAKRTSAITRHLRDIEQESGEGRLFIANVIGPRRSVRQRIATAVQAGAEAVLVAPSIMGFDIVSETVERGDVMVFAHSSFTLSFTRVPGYGLTLALWAKLQRLLGADGILLPSHGGSFGVSADETRNTVRSCLGDQGVGIAPAAPAHSGSMSALTVDLLRDLSGGDDFVITSGSGLFDHPDGVEAGARALRAAVERRDPDGPTDWIKAWESEDR